MTIYNNFKEEDMKGFHILEDNNESIQTMKLWTFQIESKFESIRVDEDSSNKHLSNFFFSTEKRGNNYFKHILKGNIISYIFILDICFMFKKHKLNITHSYG